MRLGAAILMAAALSGLGGATAMAATDLSPRLTMSSQAVVGSTTPFTIAVHNYGPDPTSGTTTVTDALPPGLTPVSADGSGWSCALAQTVTCSSSDAVAAGGDFPPIALVAAVGAGALPGVANVASVANAGDGNAANDADGETLVVRTAHDASVAFSATGRFDVDRDERLRITVANAGTFPTMGITTVDDVLPAGVSFISAEGDDWSCALVPGEVAHVRCTTAAVVGGGVGGLFPRIELIVRPTLAAWPSFVDTATVTAVGDQFAPNDTSSVTVRLSGTGPPDLSLQITPRTLSVDTPATFGMTVRRTGATPTGTTLVTGALPASLGPVSASGTGWTCAIAPQLSCTTTSASPGRIAVVVKPTAAAVPAVAIGATVHNDGDRNAANDGATASLTVRPLVFGAFRVDAAWRVRRHGPPPARRLTGLAVRRAHPGAALDVRCVAGCRHPKLLASATARRSRRGTRLHFAHALVVRASTVLTVSEHMPGSATVTQRCGFERKRHGGWRLQTLSS
jgi:uncharacterized repeat protein (TIGR01451 family)